MSVGKTVTAAMHYKHRCYSDARLGFVTFSSNVRKEESMFVVVLGMVRKTVRKVGILVALGIYILPVLGMLEKGVRNVGLLVALGIYILLVLGMLEKGVRSMGMLVTLGIYNLPVLGKPK